MASETLAVFSPDSKLIALPSYWTSSIRFFDAQSGVALEEVASSRWGIFESEIKCAAFSPDHSHIVAGEDDHTLQVRSVVTGHRVARLKDAVKGDITCLKFSPDGARVALGDSTGAVRCWEWSTNHTYTHPNPHQARVTSVVFTPNGNRIVSGSSEGSLRVWNPESESTPWGTPSMTIKSLEFHSSSDGLRLLCRSEKQAVEIWDFGKDEKDESVIPCISWRTDDGCFLAEQPFGWKFSMRDDGWLLDGDSRICWIPKIYRPFENHFFMGKNRLTCTTGKDLIILDFSTIGKA
jgi:WD40 repeat protein